MHCASFFQEISYEIDMSRLNLLGQTFGRWTVIADAGNNERGDATWECICVCGTKKIVRGGILRARGSTSCGCYHKEVAARVAMKTHTTHGKSKISEYGIWQTMHTRCSNPNHEYAKYYSERGIAVCPEWHSFEQFFADMGPRPSPKHSIDRIDNGRGYCKENCRWATSREQALNTRRNVWLTWQGETLCAADWCARMGWPDTTVAKRIRRGWTTERALTQRPKNKKHATITAN